MGTDQIKNIIAVMTEWDIYRGLDYDAVYRSMEKPAFFFDGRNVADHQTLFDIGFNVYPTGGYSR